MDQSPLKRSACHSSESASVHGYFREEVSYILNKPYKLLDVIVVPRLPPVQDVINLVQGDMYPIVINVMS